MSISSLPEWKQLLLEKKRREEEEREQREKEEEEKFASMPAWKRGIIQRRRARQESLGDREKEREVCVLQVDVRSTSEGLNDTDRSVTVNLGSELSLSPDPGLWLDLHNKQASQVSLETIVPVHENPFIRTQSSWKKGRDCDADKANEPEVKEREKTNPRAHDVDSGSGRHIELRIERFRDLSEGRDKERSKDKSQGRESDASRDRHEKRSWRESVKDRELLKAKKDEEEKEADPSSPVFSPLPCLRTIRADNIIIIEQDSKICDERRGRWTEAEREEEDQQAKRGMKMDLREILAGGGSVTEIRASEVLIIKPSGSLEERNPGKGREDAEAKGKEYKADMSWLREKVKEAAKDKDRPWGQAAVIKEDRKDSLDDDVFVERGGRVSKLLSKFGEHPKLPCRSKSSDNFMRPGSRKHSGEDDDGKEFVERRANGRDVEQMPKRSFSFSDQVVCGKENGLDEDGWKMRGRIHSDKSVAAKVKMDCARLLDKDRFGRYTDTAGKEDRIRNDKSDVKKVEPVDIRAAEKAVDADGDKGFTVASIKNTEGISFARRVPIRQDGKGRVEREVKRLVEEKSLEREGSIEKDTEKDMQICDKKDVQPDCASENMQKNDADESHYRPKSAFTDCSSLLCAVPDSLEDLHKGPDWNGQQASYLSHSVLSQHTEELISKIEKIGDTTVCSTERNERPHRAHYDVTQDSNQESVIVIGPDMLTASKRTSNMGTHPGPLEIQIPRTVFYVAEEMAEKKKPEEGQEWDGGNGVERRDSWRVGKPLSRIESLREKIRQRELEKQRQRETQDGEQGKAIEMCDNGSTTAEEGGTEAEEEWEAVAHMRKSLVEAETGQEEVEGQTSMTVFDVTQEVLKTCHQLPVSASEAVSAEELTNTQTVATAATASELYSNSIQLSKEEDNPLKYVKEELNRYRENECVEDQREEEISEEEEEDGYTLVLDSEESITPSSPHPSSLVAMSRIYNLETVGTRSGLCLRDRTVEIPSVHLVKVKPLVSQQENSCGIQKIQRQIEHFQLKEQEVLKSQNAGCTSPRRDRETKGQHSPRGVLKPVKEDVKTLEKTQEMSDFIPKVSSPTSHLKQNQSITIMTSPPRGQSPENTLKPLDYAPTPASSPCSLSPAQSPSLSPSPSPSPTLFSIRSASGGQVKRGATITITPKKPTGGVRGGATVSTPSVSTDTKTPSQPTQTPNTGPEPTKKKYPTVDEIKVIGGYLNLEKSCLVKNRGTPKKVKVCFDEDKLEQVCEYPSETSVLACSPFPHDTGRTDNPQGDEEQEKETETETGKNVSKTTRNMGTATGRGPRVGQCHPLLKKHSV